MQLQRLRLVNFRQHADTELIFGPGITAIIGPNGSGKTTLLEAIAWAFYGNPAARGSRDSIRRYRAPARSQVKVEVDFVLGAHEFHVERGLYNAALSQDGQDEPLANSQQEVTAHVTRVLGMTRDEFFNTYFTGQKELAVMGTMGPTDRARFLSRVLGYDRLKLAQDKLREHRSRRRSELVGLEQGLADEAELKAELKQARGRVTAATRRVKLVTDTVGETRRALETEGPAWTRMVEIRESVLSLDSEARVAERDVREARREFERLDKELAEALDARTQLESVAAELAPVGPLTEELEQLERQAQAAGRRRALAGQLREIGEQSDRMRQRVTQLGDTDRLLARAVAALEQARTDLAQAEVDAERAHTTWIRDRQDAETKRQSLRDQYRDLQKQKERIVVAGPEGTCPTCARSLGTEYETVLAAIDRQLEEIAIDGKYFNQRVSQLSEEPKELQEARLRSDTLAEVVERSVQEAARCEDRVQERRDAEAELHRLESRLAELDKEIAELPDAYDADRQEEVREQLRVLDPVRKKSIELQVKAEGAEQLVGEAELAEKKLSDHEARFERLRSSIASLGFSDEKYAEVRARYEKAEAAVREAELELASVQGDLKAAETGRDQVERRLKERKEREAQVRTIKRDLRMHDELDRGFHDLRLELNAAMRPEIAERASTFLSDLTDARYSELELDEQYRTTVIEDGVPKPVISGGEEDLVNLVLRLAISQMVAERAGQPLSLLVLDEIFGGLDESRRYNVVELLRRLGVRFPQVILITHIETVRNGVDRVLRVEFDQRGSTAVVTEDGGAALE
ncbi:MAG: AAA family ATPase [Gemmatimonadota bacterium]|nr:MAG: AAA family ATPase [Gemmatimonadota bacterium]